MTTRSRRSISRRDAAGSFVRNLAALLVSLLLVVFAAVPLSAQSSAQNGEGPDYVQWEALAELAETALSDRTTPEAVLVDLRAQIVGWRAGFVEVQNFNRERIDILREQVDALGPPPAEGETEASEIAERRADLTARLANRQAPLVTADEAHRRADAIIRAIDRQLRERQAEALTRLWPTPLNPANWPAGADALVSSGYTIWGELYNSWLDPRLRGELLSGLPLLALLLAAALLLLIRGRRWMETLTNRMLRSTTLLRGRFLAAFLLSLAQIVVPLVGLALLYAAFQLSGLGGVTTEAILDAILEAGIVLILARWLSLRLFPVVEDPALNLRLDGDTRRAARRSVVLLAVLGAWTLIFEALIQPDSQSDAAVAVLLFPLILLTGLVLFRFGALLLRHSPVEAHGDADAAPSAAGPGFVDRAFWIGARVVMGIAVAAPLLAAVGYIDGARELLFPAIETLGLLGLVLILQRLVTAIYEAVLSLPEGSSNALVPALAGFVLTLAAVPMVALIWGVRETELLEIWERFRAGFSLGETRISPANILSFLVIFAIGYMLTRAVQGALSSSVLPKTTLEKGAQKAIVSGLGYVGIVIAALIAFSTAGIDLSGLAIVAGALTVGIGFGLQNIVSNFVSGVILLIERPVSEGDWVEVGSTQGFVSRISVRSTVIETFDKSEVIVPNADLISGVVTNYTKTNKTGRLILPVSVAYGTDTRRVEAILREIAEANPIVAMDPPPAVLFTGFGADGLDFEVRVILRDVGFIMRVASDMRHEIARAFTTEGLEIPFAQRDIWLRNPEVLPGSARPPKTEPAPPQPAPASPAAPLSRELYDDTGDTAGSAEDSR